ncbi:unnamed protein product, partial [marine sediment metagenome]
MSETNESASAENVESGAAGFDVGCLIARIGHSEVRWRFRDPHAPSLEIAATLEEQLRHFLAERGKEAAGKRHVMDLQQLPALSSRQLGTMLTLSKVVQTAGGLSLTHVSEATRQ